MFIQLFPVIKNPLLLSKDKKFGFYCKRFCGQKIMRILNVAEKNDAAKNIALFLSKGKMRKREGASTWNKVYEFESDVFGQNDKMIMTSVSGHLLNYDFVGQYRKWSNTNPIVLFEAPVQKICISSNEAVKRNLIEEARNCNVLVIWTDCDREGENIGFEIIEVCKEVKANIKVYRAKFSEITEVSVRRALKSLEIPNKYLNDAVNVRMELDLRIGAAFTRFQCLHLKKAFPIALKENLVSYGSCQFPTLGFVVERFKAISEFIPESFWKINVQHIIGNMTVNFQWERVHLFDKLACTALHDKCKESNYAQVVKVESKKKTKWRPKPLDTVELEKLASRKLQINAKEALKIAEKLYTQGLISYPRTETNIFPKELNLVPLVQLQTQNPAWGDFAERVLRDGPNPFQGKKSDQAHPPIHPIKYSDSLRGNEKKIYELIVRHFLACLSKHAEGLETTVNIDVAEEKFIAKGLMITAKNYLDVYPYENWSDKEIHNYREGDTFIPEITMNEGETSPPELLTEADLIALMEKHGIGTDATHAEHIETIKARLYVGLQNNKYFVPRTLGMGLVEGYINMGYEMAKPELRANLEADLKRICENKKSPQEVLNTYIAKYKEIYEGVQRQVNRLSETIQSYIQVEALPVASINTVESDREFVMKCSSCGSAMFLKKKKNDTKYIGCSNYPQCRRVVWFPSIVKDATITNEICSVCEADTHLIKFNFERGSCYLPSNYVGCVGGCDKNLLEILSQNSKPQQENRRSTKDGRVPATDSTANPSPLSEIFDSGIGSFTEDLNDSENAPKCHCNVPAIRLTVKKQGPNLGRAFYKCSAPRNSIQCNYFEWVDDSARNKTVRTDLNSSADNANFEDEVRCYCAIPCRKLSVLKEGQNKGREFFGCGKNGRSEDKCNFFKWIT